MRTEAEIVARIHELSPKDFFGFETGDLIERLSFEAAKPFLKPDYPKEEWEEKCRKPNTLEAITFSIQDYMDFALSKATGHRGLSSTRSVAHYRAWLWLIGDDELVEFIDSPNSYPMYGMPILKKICDNYDCEFPDTDVAEKMLAGEPCHPECVECNA